MKAALQAMDWAGYARIYNGPSYSANDYDTKLAAAYARFSMGSCPDLTVRAVQVYLTYLGYNPGPIDGVVGPSTSNAVEAFQLKAKAPEGADLPATLELLRAA